MIRYRCPKCRAALGSPSSMAGQEDTCPACGTSCTVPKTSSHLKLVLGVSWAAFAVVAALTVVLLWPKNQEMEKASQVSQGEKRVARRYPKPKVKPAPQPEPKPAPEPRPKSQPAPPPASAPKPKFASVTPPAPATTRATAPAAGRPPKENEPPPPPKVISVLWMYLHPSEMTVRPGNKYALRATPPSESADGWQVHFKRAENVRVKEPRLVLIVGAGQVVVDFSSANKGVFLRDEGAIRLGLPPGFAGSAYLTENSSIPEKPGACKTPPPALSNILQFGK